MWARYFLLFFSAVYAAGATNPKETTTYSSIVPYTNENMMDMTGHPEVPFTQDSELYQYDDTAAFFLLRRSKSSLTFKHRLTIIILNLPRSSSLRGQTQLWQPQNQNFTFLDTESMPL